MKVQWRGGTIGSIPLDPYQYSLSQEYQIGSNMPLKENSGGPIEPVLATIGKSD
jgi:hypothetical protein